MQQTTIIHHWREARANCRTRLRDVTLFLGLTSLAAAQAPGLASAQGVIDQSHECAQQIFAIAAFSPMGQSFTPARPNITGIEVRLSDMNNPRTDTIVLNLRDGGIAGPILATASLFLQAPPAGFGWFRYNFPSPVAVTPGATYVIELQAGVNNYSWGWVAALTTSSCPDYLGGVAMATNLPQGITPRDWEFRTYTLCGNGVLDVNEECDAGAANGGQSCCSAACEIRDAGTQCRGAADLCDVADVCNGSSPTCPDLIQPMGTPCRLAGGECGLDDACTGASVVCPDNHKPAGTACTSDGLTCTLDQCNGSGACTHPAGNAGTVCRAAANACDIAESCNGTSTTCPSDQVRPDNDHDGECDLIDPCTNNGSQTFIGRPKPKVVLSKINTDTQAGNDKLNILGEFPLPLGVSFGNLTPGLLGARVVLEAEDGSRVADVAVPPGTYSTVTRRGWKRGVSGKAWTFVDRSGAPVNGITKVVIADKDGPQTPRYVRVTVSGSAGTYPVVAGDQPVNAMVTLGDAGAAAAGMCGESAFASDECTFNGTGNTLTCRP